MGNRYGRNQKRRARAEIEQLRQQISDLRAENEGRRRLTEQLEQSSQRVVGRYQAMLRDLTQTLAQTNERLADSEMRATAYDNALCYGT